MRDDSQKHLMTNLSHLVRFKPPLILSDVLHSHPSCWDVTLLSYSFACIFSSRIAPVLESWAVLTALLPTVRFAPTPWCISKAKKSNYSKASPNPLKRKADGFLWEVWRLSVRAHRGEMPQWQWQGRMPRNVWIKPKSRREGNEKALPSQNDESIGLLCGTGPFFVYNKGCF